MKELYREAVDLRKWFATAGAWFGAYVGLVIGVKLIHLSAPPPAHRLSARPLRLRRLRTLFLVLPGRKGGRGWDE